jgi:hypothetical protein
MKVKTRKTSAQKKNQKSLKDLLLKGPTMTPAQLVRFKRQRKEFAKWKVG